MNKLYFNGLGPTMATFWFLQSESSQGCVPRIVMELLGFAKDDPAGQAMLKAGIKTVLDLMDIEEQGIKRLDFNAPSNSQAPNIKPLDWGSKRLVQILKAYLMLLGATRVRHGSSACVMWETLTVEDFDKYRMT